MIKKLCLTFILLHSVVIAFGCCGAGQHRLFPVGIVNNKIISVQFTMSRFCGGEHGEGSGNTNTFEWRIEVNLVREKNDTIELVQVIDSMFIMKECTCTYKTRDSLTRYYENLLPHFQKAHKTAKTLAGFEPLAFKSLQYIEKNDGKIIEFDTIFNFQLFKKKKTYHYQPALGASGYVMRGKIIREFQYGKRKIYAVTFKENYFDDNPKEDIYKPDKIARINSIEDSFFYEGVNWHGWDVDHVFWK